VKEGEERRDLKTSIRRKKSFSTVNEKKSIKNNFLGVLLDANSFSRHRGQML
jgi:hypothetical protein